MRVVLLGPVSAESRGVSFRLGGLKQRAVFALLALNARRVVPLDRFVDELWSEEPPSRATLGLQSYVSRLRRVLAADPEAPRLLTQPPGWTLDLDPAAVDVTRFEELIARARKSADARELLSEALGLWHGEPLADLQAVPFAREEAARLGELRLGAEEMLLEAALVTGDAETVVAAGGRFVAANPFRERGWRALALGLYRTGRQSEALAALARLRRGLADELGLDPAEETRALEAGILRHDPALAPAPPPAVELSRPAGAETDDLLLLGRAAAIAAIDRTRQAARAGRGALLVLEASAGAGKTTLLTAAAERVAAAGGHVVHGSGVGTAVMPALWPWVTIVRELAARLPGDIAGPALELMETGGSQTRLFRSIVDLMLAAHRRAPLMVVLDDLQWIDPDSLTLLALAVDQLVGHGVLFAVAVRSGEPSSGAVLATLRRDAVVRLPLPGLGVDDVGEVVRRVSGRPPGAGVAEALHRRTEGNPLFVGELTRLLVSEQRLDAAAVREALPSGVEEVLRRRLDRLPRQTVALLTVVALAGGPVQVDTLAAVTGLDADAVLDACESALLAELLVEDGPGFALRHDLVRQTLERGVSQARRVRLHARLADTLRSRGVLSPEDVVAVARHLALAEPVAGAAAVPYLAAAADDALTRNAYREAERLLEQALELAGRADGQAERARLARSVRSRLAVVRVWSDGTRSEVTGGDDQPDPAESTAGWVNALVTRGVSGRYGEVVAIAERALATPLAPAAVAAAHFVAGWAQTVRGRLDEAAEHLRAAEDHDVGVPAIRVAAAAYAAIVAHCQGDEAAADRADRLARDRAGDDDTLTMEADLYAAWLRAMRGDAEGCLERAAACARDQDSPFGIHAQVLVAWAEAMGGDPDASDRADEAYARVAASGVPLFVPFYLLLCAEAHARAGHADRAGKLIAEASARSAVLGDVCRAPRLVKLGANGVQGSRKP
ncbi:BTAD domain-containing putative transcriptional regulator [Paractinoplanes maris]|uniref:BTAD domain-containing putative transcriptional regulator n=1 Tax=Paractinoplanes maris TaxID=1734446 RepID=UPI00201FC75C|nr:BTAD domain-containing putative transcriptional regulator [Actinoplanes maris]